MSEYRTGSNWGVTIVRRGTGPDLQDCFRREDDELVAVVVNGDQDLAERICALLNTGTHPHRPKPGCPYCGTGLEDQCPWHSEPPSIADEGDPR